MQYDLGYADLEESPLQDARQRVWPKSVTYVSGTNCYPCLGATRFIMIQSYGLSHIQLTVSDLERSVRFYSEILGMEELCRFGTNAAMLRTPKSHEVFTLNANSEGAADIGKMGGIAHFGFRLMENVDMIALSDELEKAGAVIIEHGKRGKDKKETYVFVRDPDGYEIEFFWMPEE